MKVIFAITRRWLISDDIGARQRRILMSWGDIWLSLLCPFPSVKAGRVFTVCPETPTRFIFFRDPTRKVWINLR